MYLISRGKEQHNTYRTGTVFSGSSLAGGTGLQQQLLLESHDADATAHWLPEP